MATRHYTDQAAEEESYFISMTDVFIGLLFVFIIMLMFFAMRFQEATERQKDETRKQEIATQRQDEVTQKQGALIEDLTDAEATRAAVLQNIGDFLQSRGLNVTIIRDEGILRLPEEMLFAKANWELGARGVDASRTLRTLGDALDQVLPCYTLGTRSRQDNCPKTKAKIEAIFIEGHADADALVRRVRPAASSDQPKGETGFSLFRRTPSPPSPPTSQADNRASSGPPKDNLDLSALRATSAYRELLRVKKELSLYLNPTGEQVLSVSGYGEYRPVAPLVGETVENFKQRNRRIDLRILMAAPRSEDARQFQRDLQYPEVRQ
jgi:outer membrane protein OmpA-like peptidoglycan-associated protein